MEKLSLRRTHVALILALAAGLSVAGVQWWRTRASRTAPTATRAELVKDLTARAKEQYRKVAMAPVTGLSSPSDVARVLEGAHRPSAPSIGEWDSLKRTASEFIHIRFVTNSLDEYKAWRVRQGYELAPREELVGVLGASDAFRRCADREIPESMDAESIFDEVWTLCDPKFGPQTRLASIATGSEGISVLFGTTRPGIARRALLPDASANSRSENLPPELWLGGGAGATQPWWRLPESTDDMVERCKETSYAEIGLAVEYESGARHPLGIVFVWDPFRKLWRLEGIVIYNATDPGAGLGIY